MSQSPIDDSDLSPAQVAQFTPIIDDILSNADLSTITPKKIILGLQERLGFDITELKKPIKALINQRFDVVSAQQHPSPKDSSPPKTVTAGAENNHVAKTMNGTSANSKKRPSPTPSSSATPPPAKKHKPTPAAPSSPKAAKASKSRAETDAEMAARLQAMENGRARSTRGGGSNSATIKKRAKVGTPKKGIKAKTEKRKKVSRATVDSADDSDIEGSDDEDGEKKEKVKKGGFHKPMVLSASLGELLGETTLSRPECVKRIWEYIRKHDLQDPKDRRTIRCDEAMKKVFRQEKVTMFSMNKHLSGQLYAPEEV